MSSDFSAARFVVAAASPTSSFFPSRLRCARTLQPEFRFCCWLRNTSRISFYPFSHCSPHPNFFCSGYARTPRPLIPFVLSSRCRAVYGDDRPLVCVAHDFCQAAQQFPKRDKIKKKKIGIEVSRKIIAQLLIDGYSTDDARLISFTFSFFVLFSRRGRLHPTASP